MRRGQLRSNEGDENRSRGKGRGRLKMRWLDSVEQVMELGRRDRAARRMAAYMYMRSRNFLMSYVFLEWVVLEKILNTTGFLLWKL